MTEGGRFRLAGFAGNGVLIIPWSTETGDSGRYSLDPATLEPVTFTAAFEPEYPAAVHARLSDAPGLSVNLSDDQGGVQEDGTCYVLKWESRGASHGRHAPEVIPDGPVSRLVVLKIRARK
jgi:hypothetical protein